MRGVVGENMVCVFTALLIDDVVSDGVEGRQSCYKSIYITVPITGFRWAAFTFFMLWQALQEYTLGSDGAVQ